jgi:MFS transporter, DHA2 family, multidrug resistance protein
MGSSDLTVTVSYTVRGRRWWALGALSLAVLAVGLDGTVLSVALPTLATALRASESDLQWFSSGYFLVLASAMLPAGLLGDRYGRKKVLLASLGLFGLGSAASAYSGSVEAFLLARILLGVAGAGIIVMALSGLTVLFTEQERPKAVGIWAAANFVALPIGPILGGWLLSHYWWGWVFLMNVPVVVIGLIATLALVPESRAAQRPGLDPVGVGLSVAGLVGVTYGLIEAGEFGWGDRGAWLLIVCGVLLLAGFFRWERGLNRRPGGQPLLDLALFGSTCYLWGVILAAVAVLAMTGVLFTMPQYFQGVLGTDAAGSGLRLLPLIGGLLLGAVPASQVARVIGAKIAMAVGFGVLAAGLSFGSTTTLGSGGGFLATWMAIAGLGVGLAMATATSAALSELSQDQAGVGSAVLQAVNKIGGPFGTAILGSLLSSAYLAHLNLSGLPPRLVAPVRQSIFAGVRVAHQDGSTVLLQSVRSAFVHGMDLALVASAGVAVTGAVLALAFLPGGGTAPEGGPARSHTTIGWQADTRIYPKHSYARVPRMWIGGRNVGRPLGSNAV